MSRIGKKPVPVPAGVTANVDGQTRQDQGLEGRTVLRGARRRLGRVRERRRSPFSRARRRKRARSLWGTSRARVANLVTGVTTGFEKKLEINGVGYKAAVTGKVLKLSLGYSHDIDYPIPDGITIVTPKPTEIVITGIDKQVVGQIAAEIRDYRGPEPYKGKGVKYAGEFIFRKEGKKK